MGSGFFEKRRSVGRTKLGRTHNFSSRPVPVFLWQGLLALSIWIGLIAFAFWLRNVLTVYAGSLVAYLSPYKDSKFETLRSDIQQVGLDAANLIYEVTSYLPSGFRSTKRLSFWATLAWIGHRLRHAQRDDQYGSRAQSPGDPNPAVDRTRDAITFGFTPDKTAFLFRVQLRSRL